MTAYNIIHRHPEWVTSERTPRAAIQNEARRYVRELEGSKNFCSLITEDLDDLLRHRDATNDFAGIVTDNSNKTQVSEESPEYMADKRKAQIYAIFIKAVISELSGKAICTAAQVEEWRERYAVKLEGLEGKREQTTKHDTDLKPIDDTKAEQIYGWLKKQQYIDCNEDVFMWHFGERIHRTEKDTPKKINWLGNDDRVFVVCCNKINKIATGKERANWIGLKKHFNPNPDWGWDQDWKNVKDRKNEAVNRSLYDNERLKVIAFFDSISEKPKDAETKSDLSHEEKLKIMKELPNEEKYKMIMELYEPK